ncbi:MAG: DNA ligase D [Polyangiaceae bacterium]
MATKKPLDRYRAKRDPSVTSEPLGGDPEPSGKQTYRGAFVVHQHAATHMHFDLRLEIGGVLASFALPKGPTLDPEKKHLAIETEEHPLEYLDFEAIIPKGNYGGGAMIVWDFGFARYLDTSAEVGLRTGKLHFALEGKKLRGRFALVRVKGRDKPSGAKSDDDPGEGYAPGSREWLFFKKPDAAASPRDLITELPRSVLSGLTVTELAEAPAIARAIEADAERLGAPLRAVDGRKLSPMLCSFGEIPKGAGWLYELKMDGVRVVATKDARGVELTYRSGRSTTDAYPEVVRAISALASESVVLDGEIVAFDETGRPSFERLARRVHGAGRADLRVALMEVPVVFVLFDILAIGKRATTDLPLRARKELLRRLVPGSGILRVLDHLEGDGAALFEFCRKNGLEGVVSKRADSNYVTGPTRTASWIKTKCEQEASFVVVGYTHGENSRHRLGGLDLASYEDGKLHLRGRVGSGLTDPIIDELLARMTDSTAERATSIGEYEPAPRGRVHVHPEIVVRVRYLEWSDEGSLRFPVFLGIDHKTPKEGCTASPHDVFDRTVEATATSNPARTMGLDEPPPPSIRYAKDAPVEVRISNRTKIFWPAEGYTKGDLVDYYDRVAPVLLPYLEDRPVMVVRYPDGIEGKSFFQWNVPHGTPNWVRSITLGKHAYGAGSGPEVAADEVKTVFIVDRKETLLFLANLACIPIHVLGSRTASPDQADFLTIDFDVARSSLAVATKLAHTLRGLLDEVGLPGFPKTSGQTGLHVFVSLGPNVTPEAARTLADLFGRLIVERHPEEATMQRVPARRGTKVYVDTGQTGPSRTIVAPYSVRATPGARVSAPLDWSEVTPDLDPSAFTIRTIPDRIAKVGDPMRGLLTSRPNIASVMERLGAILAGKAKDPAR